MSERFIVSREDIEEVRRALLYVCAWPTMKGNKRFAQEAENRFFDAHDRLNAILKSAPHPDSPEGGAADG